MRTILAAALALGLSGCGSVDFFGDSEDSTTASAAAVDRTGTAAQPPGDAAPMAQVAAAPDAAPASLRTTEITSPNQHCVHIAKQRATDAAYAGEDEETQEAVYNRTYASCRDWDARHGS